MGVESSAEGNARTSAANTTQRGRSESKKCGRTSMSTLRLSVVLQGSVYDLVQQVPHHSAQCARMVLQPKLTAKDFFDFLPPNSHRTGDIWTGLPSFGVLTEPHVTGIVITPSCDLAQNKSETISYVPIVPIASFFYMNQFYFEIWQEISNILRKRKIEARVTPPKRFSLPAVEEIEGVIDIINEETDRDVVGDLDRLKNFVTYIQCCVSRSAATIAVINSIIMPSRRRKLMQSIIRNAYRSDTHFIPADGKSGIASAVSTHSVCLFRYTMTIATDILDVAQETSPSEWTSRISKMKLPGGVASQVTARPVRMATVRAEFMSDLLSRLISMYIRLGSRDFTDDTIAFYTKELEGATI